jgi:hypothetical protein
MSPLILISLVGEQPAPNVLPLKHYQPECVVLVHTDRTRRHAERIARVLGAGKVITPFCQTGAFRVSEIKAALARYLQEHGLEQADLLFNLTGGTKTMEYAALELARQLKARAFYYQAEDNADLIHPYQFNPAGELVCGEPVPIQSTLSLADFLHLYIGEFTVGEFRNDFERSVAQVLKSLGSDYEVLTNLYLPQVGPNVEVDWVLRYRNTIAVGEVKVHASKTAGIDQLNGVTDQRTLGTYTRKFLISAQELHPNDLLLADAYRIKTIHLPSGNQPPLSPQDASKLIQTIRLLLEPHP